MSKMYVHTQQTRRQMRYLVRTLLEQEQGKIFDPIKAASWLRQVYGLIVDWHECSAALEEMRTFEMAEYDDSTRRLDGMHNYYIKP